MYIRNILGGRAGLGRATGPDRESTPGSEAKRKRSYATLAGGGGVNGSGS